MKRTFRSAVAPTFCLDPDMRLANYVIIHTHTSTTPPHTRTYFSASDTEAQRRQMTCLRSHSQ